MSQIQYNKKDTAIHEVYNYVDHKWIRKGWRCALCDKFFKSKIILDRHINICPKINTSKENEIMPIQRIMKNGTAYYRWGDSGKLYRKREDAEKQAQAAYASGYKEKKDNK